jgi:hypothetical protein
MKKNSTYRLVTSGLLTIIATISLSMSLTMAWFYANRKIDNTLSSITMRGVVGDVYYYSGNNFDNDFSGFTTAVYGGSDQTLNDGDFINGDNTSGGYFVKMDSEVLAEGTPFVMKQLLPNVRHAFMLRVKSLYDGTTTIKINIDQYSSENGDSSTDKIGKDATSGDTWNIALTEAIHIYIGDSSLYSTTEEQSSFKNSVESFLNGVSGTSLTNVFEETAEESTSKVTLSTIPVSSGVYTYFPIMFEFSNDPSTYYIREDDGYYYHDSVNGNSNVYQGMQFTIEQMSLYPYDE